MSENKEIKWASLNDLLTPVPEQIIKEAREQAWRFVYDADNWILEQSSTTSGMYGSWSVKICSSTTVKDVRLSPPVGVGGDLIDTFKDFIVKMKKFCDDNNL